MILRNSFYNLLGMGLPTGVALVAIPILIQALGAEKFGVLTIILAVVSYFGLFDMGLGRALTQQVALLHRSDPGRLKNVLLASNALLLTLGLCGGLCMAAAAGFITGQILQTPDDGEVARSMLWLAAAMPFVVLTSGHRGTLEGLQRFGLVNALRVPMGVFTFGAPLVVVMLGHPRLDLITASLCFGRVAGWAAHAFYAERALPGAVTFGRADRDHIRSLLRLGGWMTVSNVISPLMSYVDRFALGFMISAVAVAHYTTPQELILRAGMVPAALATALFPLFAATAGTGGRVQKSAEARRYSLVMGVLTLPLAAVLFIWPETLLTWWIDPVFAEASAPILRVMAFAVVASALAQVPFAMLQASGRSDVTAKVHLIEFPLYVGLLYTLILLFGPVGAAWAWLIRITADMVAMYVLNSKMISDINTGGDNLQKDKVRIMIRDTQ